MATRTSSPPGSRGKNTSARKSGQGGSSTRSRPSGNKTGRKPAQKSTRSRTLPASGAAQLADRRPGPCATGRVRSRCSSPRSAGCWRRPGWGSRTPSVAAYAASGTPPASSTPQHRRDGAGLFLVGVALVVAAAVWWQLPGGIGDFTRTVVAGSVGLLAWLVPLLLCFVAWRNLRDPEANGPAGRQVIGWTALLFGVLGIVHIANGSPTPQLGDTAPLQQAGGAIGFVVSKLLMDLLQTAYVVVPLLRAAGALRCARGHRDARLPDPDPAACPRRPGHGPAGARRGGRRAPRGPPSSWTPPRRRDRPRDGGPGLRHARPRGPRDRQARAEVPRRRERSRPRHRGDRRGGRCGEGRSRATTAHAAPGPRGAALPLRRRHLLPAGQPGAQAGLGAQGPLEGLRRGRRAPHAGARGVRHRRPGHRLHAWPDRHPLHRRARSRGQGREDHRHPEEHRVRRGLGRRTHPQPDPGQVGGRHRDPERRQGDRLPG